MIVEERTAPGTSDAVRPVRPPGEDSLSPAERRRASLLGVPIALGALAICAFLGLLIRAAVFTA